jgi:hypothetical protein
MYGVPTEHRACVESVFHPKRLVPPSQPGRYRRNTGRGFCPVGHGSAIFSLLHPADPDYLLWLLSLFDWLLLDKP